MYKKFKKGFTLVELIVVMAIIAILSTVAVVSYSAIVKKAEQSKVDSELAQIVNVLRAEAAETETIIGDDGELTLALSEEGELQFSAKLNTENEEDKKNRLNSLFDTMLEVFELKEYAYKLDLDLVKEDLVYTVETVSATLDVYINLV